MSISIILSLAVAIPVFVAIVSLLAWAVANPAVHGQVESPRAPRGAHAPRVRGRRPAPAVRAAGVRERRVLKPLEN